MIVNNFLFILLFIFAAMGVGWYLGYVYRSRDVKYWYKRYKAAVKIPDVEIETANGNIKARFEEWPHNIEEYLGFHSLDPDGGIIEITYNGLVDHCNGWASHIAARQKRDFIKMLKQLGPEETFKRISIETQKAKG